MPVTEKTSAKDLGSCCTCRVRPARTVVMIDRIAPVAGSGWGCTRCQKPQDGAVSVLCDQCLARHQAGQAIVRVCVGKPRNNLRMPINLLGPGKFDHDYSLHPEIRRRKGILG